MAVSLATSMPESCSSPLSCIPPGRTVNVSLGWALRRHDVLSSRCLTSGTYMAGSLRVRRLPRVSSKLQATWPTPRIRGPFRKKPRRRLGLARGWSGPTKSPRLKLTQTLAPESQITGSLVSLDESGRSLLAYELRTRAQSSLTSADRSSWATNA